MYDGAERWTAGGETAGLASLRAARVLAAYRPQAYHLVDAGAVTGTITEAGGSATFTVVLGDQPPTADVTVAVKGG